MKWRNGKPQGGFPSKFRNKFTTIDGIKFRSLGEARRYEELRILKFADEIADLKCQPRYPLEAYGRPICTYVADFSYFDRKAQRNVVEDVKGFKTELYKLKKKLFEAQYRISITELRPPKIKRAA